MSISRNEFAEHEGSEFRMILAGDDAVKVSLTEVSAVRESEGHEAFSIVFLVPLSVEAEGGTYKLAHKTLGEFELFLSPFSQDENGTSFEAVFNLLKT